MRTASAPSAAIAAFRAGPAGLRVSIIALLAFGGAAGTASDSDKTL
jgi:hypothetical protein